MIKLFRKVRRQLVSEHKLTKYILYALGEIILVVIGILLALQINTWNEQRKMRISEAEFIEGVKHDLIQDREFIKKVIAYNQPKIDAYEYLNKWSTTGMKESREIADSVYRDYLYGQRTFYPISGTFESAVAGNQLNTFQDKKVTRAIIKLYNSTYARLLDNAINVDKRWDYISKKYSYERRTGNFKDPDIDYFITLIDEISYHAIQLQWYKNTLELAVVEIDGILENQ